MVEQTVPSCGHRLLYVTVTQHINGPNKGKPLLTLTIFVLSYCMLSNNNYREQVTYKLIILCVKYNWMCCVAYLYHAVSHDLSARFYELILLTSGPSLGSYAYLLQIVYRPKSRKNNQLLKAVVEEVLKKDYPHHMRSIHDGKHVFYIQLH